jgi:hypothetical protein
VDQEERASRQDPVDDPGSRSGRSRSRSGQAPHLARPQADARESVGGFAEAIRSARSRRRSQEQDRVRPVHRPRRRRGRHGAPLRPRLEPSGRAGHRRVQQGRHGQGCRSRRRHRQGAHLARHQAARQGCGRRSATSGELRKNAVVTCEVIGVKDGGLEVRLVDTASRPSSSVRSVRDRDEQRPERFTVGQKVDARVIAFDKKTRKLQVSIKALESPKRSRPSLKRRKPSLSTARPTPALRSATSWAQP